MHDIVTADGAFVPGAPRIEPGPIAPDQPASRLWIDASLGASGDMLLAALLDAGADAGSVAAVLDIVGSGALYLQHRRVLRGVIDANKVDVIATVDDQPHRHLSDVLAIINQPGVPEVTRDIASRAFTLLAQAEAKVHGTTLERVHFHEVGALDSIGDIVGVAEALRTLGVTQASSSVVAVGSGSVMTQHGRLPVPAPAVADLSIGWRIEAGGPADIGELCTPTGMTLIRTVCSKVETMPDMTVRAIGLGAGSRERADRAGILRVVLGDVEHGSADDGIVEVSANVDDMDPRLWPGAIDALLAAGAVDAWLTPIIMKKGRPAHTVSALCPSSRQDGIIAALIEHTTTIGVRVSAPWHRTVLDRAWVNVCVDGDTVRVKIAGTERTIAVATPEFSDVAAFASSRGIAQRHALRMVEAAADAAGVTLGATWPED